MWYLRVQIRPSPPRLLNTICPFVKASQVDIPRSDLVPFSPMWVGQVPAHRGLDQGVAAPWLSCDIKAEMCS
ncbi:hypothetical protein U9M48_031366 [Paspalum notatum var. saurae]|uniref:Uncharacterized protein n=1 Tax=Paspalum notatum var. saurae TaxID=547442 RepID=A0AAQ3U334_PASNO